MSRSNIRVNRNSGISRVNTLLNIPLIHKLHSYRLGPWIRGQTDIQQNFQKRDKTPIITGQQTHIVSYVLFPHHFAKTGTGNQSYRVNSCTLFPNHFTHGPNRESVISCQLKFVAQNKTSRSGVVIQSHRDPIGSSRQSMRTGCSFASIFLHAAITNQLTNSSTIGPINQPTPSSRAQAIDCETHMEKAKENTQKNSENKTHKKIEKKKRNKRPKTTQKSKKSN